MPKTQSKKRKTENPFDTMPETKRIRPEDKKKPGIRDMPNEIIDKIGDNMAIGDYNKMGNAIMRKVDRSYKNDDKPLSKKQKWYKPLTEDMVRYYYDNNKSIHGNETVKTIHERDVEAFEKYAKDNKFNIKSKQDFKYDYHYVWKDGKLKVYSVPK